MLTIMDYFMTFFLDGIFLFSKSHFMGNSELIKFACDHYNNRLEKRLKFERFITLLKCSDLERR